MVAIYAIAVDDTHIYVAEVATRMRLENILKSDLSYVGQSLIMVLYAIASR